MNLARKLLSLNPSSIVKKNKVLLQTLFCWSIHKTSFCLPIQLAHNHIQLNRIKWRKVIILSLCSRKTPIRHIIYSLSLTFLRHFSAISDLKWPWMTFICHFWPYRTFVALETYFLKTISPRASHWKRLKFDLYLRFVTSNDLMWRLLFQSSKFDLFHDFWPQMTSDDLAIPFFEKLSSRASFWYIIYLIS